jgi:hypothetical protein
MIFYLQRRAKEIFEYDNSHYLKRIPHYDASSFLIADK